MYWFGYTRPCVICVFTLLQRAGVPKRGSMGRPPVLLQVRPAFAHHGGPGLGVGWRWRAGMGSKCAHVPRDCLDFLWPKTRNCRGSQGMEHETNAAQRPRRWCAVLCWVDVCISACLRSSAHTVRCTCPPSNRGSQNPLAPCTRLHCRRLEP